MTNDELLHKWLNNSISKEELNIFKQRPEYNSLTALNRYTKHMVGPTIDSEAMLKTIIATPKNQNLNTTSQPTLTNKPTDTLNKSKILRMTTWIKLGIAASLLLVMGYFIFPTHTPDIIAFSTSGGQLRNGQFLDGSKFILTGNSTISFDRNSWDKERSVKLNGEANFTVFKGSTFTVETPDITVEVLGTKFTVISEKGNFEVKCKEGSVIVKAKNGKTEEVLKAGESVAMSKTGKFTNLRQDISRFKNVPLEEAMAILEKEFRIVFFNQNDIIDTKQLLTCNFQHSNLNQALKTTLTPLGIKYQSFGPGQIRIYK